MFKELQISLAIPAVPQVVADADAPTGVNGEILSELVPRTLRGPTREAVDSKGKVFLSPLTFTECQELLREYGKVVTSGSTYSIPKSWPHAFSTIVATVWYIVSRIHGLILGEWLWGSMRSHKHLIQPCPKLQICFHCLYQGSKNPLSTTRLNVGFVDWNRVALRLVLSIS